MWRGKIFLLAVCFASFSFFQSEDRDDCRVGNMVVDFSSSALAAGRYFIQLNCSLRLWSNARKRVRAERQSEDLFLCLGYGPTGVILQNVAKLSVCNASHAVLVPVCLVSTLLGLYASVGRPGAFIYRALCYHTMHHPTPQPLLVR